MIAGWNVPLVALFHARSVHVPGTISTSMYVSASSLRNVNRSVPTFVEIVSFAHRWPALSTVSVKSQEHRRGDPAGVRGCAGSVDADDGEGVLAGGHREERVR
jgi:hypothetical protein